MAINFSSINNGTPLTQGAQGKPVNTDGEKVNPHVSVKSDTVSANEKAENRQVEASGEVAKQANQPKPGVEVKLSQEGKQAVANGDAEGIAEGKEQPAVVGNAAVAGAKKEAADKEGSDGAEAAGAGGEDKKDTDKAKKGGASGGPTSAALKKQIENLKKQIEQLEAQLKDIKAEKDSEDKRLKEDQIQGQLKTLRGALTEASTALLQAIKAGK